MNSVGIIESLKNLSADQKPLWGKMTAQHMVEHLIWTLQCSNGKLKLDCYTSPERLPILKRFLLSNKPLPQLFVNPAIGPDLLPLQYSNLEEAKSELNREIEDYYIYFDENPEALTVNPIFGKLNKEEWDILHKKHFTLHLSQFGISD